MPTEYTSMLSIDGTRTAHDDGEHCARCGALWPRDTDHDCPKDVRSGHHFKDEWSFQRTMPKPYPGNPVAGQPIAPDQPCFTCGVPFSDHARREAILRILNDSGSYESMEAVADAVLRVEP